MLEQQLETLKRAIAALDYREFHFSEIYGAGWDALYVGDKVKYGREFFNRVRAGYFMGVEDSGRKNAGGRLYLNIA
jgi:hypothetical protein